MFYFHSQNDTVIYDVILVDPKTKLPFLSFLTAEYLDVVNDLRNKISITGFDFDLDL